MSAAVIPAPPGSSPRTLPEHARAPRKNPVGFLRGRTGRWYDRLVLWLLGITATVMGLWNLTGAALYMDDEGNYTAQAFSVLEGRLAPYTYGYDHPPLGWIQLGGLAWIPNMLGLGDGTWIGATRYAMVPFFVASTLLIYLIARRMQVHRPLAALTALFFVLSPLTLTYGRQVFLDNIGLPWLLLAFWMVLSPRTALWHHISAGAFFAVAVLSKETLAIFGPALLVALLNRPSWTNRKFSVIGFLVVGGLMLGFYPLMAVLRGELTTGRGHVSLQDALTFHFVTRSGSGSLWDPSSPRSEMLRDWLYYDQYLIGIGMAAALVCLLRRRTIWISVALGTFALPVVLGTGYLPAMYIIGALPFLALAVGVALGTAWNWLETYVRSLRPSERPWTWGYAVACTTVVLLVLTGLQWSGQTRSLLTREANAQWTAALAWVQDNVPEEDTVLVPYAMWQDLNEAGRNDPWSVVAIEKADLDPEFLAANPDGWRDIEWVVVDSGTHETIDELGLSMAREALENSEPVQTIGGWSVHRVRAE